MNRVVFSVIVLTGSLHVCSGAVDNATVVFNALFDNYSAGTFPKCDPDEAVQVKIGIALRQILDLNEPTQILQVNIWLRLSWTDCRLTWDAGKTGVSSLIIPYHKIWSPDLTLYDNAENDFGGVSDYRATVYPDGSVYYYFPSVVSTLCKVDVTYFPFDKQTCPLKFGSWSYHGNDLNFTRRDGETAADISEYKENGEWEIYAAPAVRHEFYYSCCADPYPDVTFFITLRRRSRFYLMNLLFPCILMSSMAVLGFLLPPDSGEKVSLEITVLLSLSVFMLVVSETMPPTSETFPYIGMYFACALVLVSWSCVMTVTVLNVHYRGAKGQRMPYWVRTVFFNWIGRLLCMKDYQNIKNNKIHSTVTLSDEITLTDAESKASDDELNIRKKSDAYTIRNTHSWNEITNNKRLSVANERDEEIQIMKQQLQSIESVQEYLEGQKQCDEIAEEWHTLAQILDRVFMIIFFLFQFISTIVIVVLITGDH